MPRAVSSSVRHPPYQTLIDAHAAELHRFLVASIGPTEAEDCLQETFLSALRAYPRLRHGDNLRAWLYTIAHRKATDAIRAQRRHPGADLDLVAEARLASEPHRSFDDGLWMLVRGLPVFDLAYREVGERMGISEEAARQNVSAGLRRLRLEVDR